ncbi:hypothetical protein MIDIC_230147 [Alphaproteobacteria bacterium]
MRTETTSFVLFAIKTSVIFHHPHIIQVLKMYIDYHIKKYQK